MGAYVYRSVDAGRTFKQISNLTECKYGCLVVNPKDFNHLLITGQVASGGQNCMGVMVSTNAGSTWASLRINTLAGSEATSAAFAPNDPKIVYVGGRTDAYKALVYRSANGGASWTDVTDGVLQSPPNAVAVDPQDPDIAYLACSDGLWRTANGGASWTKCAIQNFWSMKGIAVNPNNPQQVFAGNSYGVNVSQNRGLTWTDITAGLAVPFVTGLYFNPGDKTLYVATEGGGLWKRAM